MELEEQWKPVVGFPGYEVSNYGEVMSYKGKVPRKKCLTDRGTNYRVTLRNGPEQISMTPSRIMAIAFLGDPGEGFVAHHKDWDYTNGRLDNVEWLPEGYFISLLIDRKERYGK